MSTAIVVFAKAPVPGLAKTRLAPALGEAGAAALAERMLRHALAQADFGDHVLVDNRHNAVGLAHGSAGLGEGGGKQGGNQQFFHQSFPGTSLILL